MREKYSLHNLLLFNGVISISLRWFYFIHLKLSSVGVAATFYTFVTVCVCFTRQNLLTSLKIKHLISCSPCTHSARNPMQWSILKMYNATREKRRRGTFILGKDKEKRGNGPKIHIHTNTSTANDWRFIENTRKNRSKSSNGAKSFLITAAYNLTLPSLGNDALLDLTRCDAGELCRYQDNISFELDFKPSFINDSHNYFAADADFANSTYTNIHRASEWIALKSQILSNTARISYQLKWQ